MQVLYLLYVWSLLPGLKTFSGPCLVLTVAIKYRSCLLLKTLFYAPLIPLIAF
jgi:hypothetical protein